MSSLLQHHGSTTDRRKPGHVELLMYRVVRVEARPMSCADCGHAWNQERNCAGCGKFVLFARRYDPFSGSYNDEITIEQSMKFPEYQNCCDGPHRVEVTNVSNRWDTVDAEPQRLQRPNGSWSTVAKLYRIWRKPVGMFGPWVQFRWNGKLHAPDLSVPIAQINLPRDAEPLTDAEAARYWFN
jgi:hypothetical protein